MLLVLQFKYADFILESSMSSFSQIKMFVACISVFLGLTLFSCTCSHSPNVTEEKGVGKMLKIETPHGLVEIDLFPQDAPKTVARVTELVKKGFYDGLTFHRVVPGFVVQGGDPRGDGTGGSGMNLPAEFNSRKHEEGTVAMARATDPNSADSQFYISLGKHSHLDGNYTIFGKVAKGFDAVRKIKRGDKIIKMSFE